MSKISLVLSALLGLALVIVVAPNILALNRGKILRNTALWLAIVLALALFYKTFGPGLDGSPLLSFGADKDNQDVPEENGNLPSGDQGYTPPKE